MVCEQQLTMGSTSRSPHKTAYDVKSWTCCKCDFAAGFLILRMFCCLQSRRLYNRGNEKYQEVRKCEEFALSWRGLWSVLAPTTVTFSVLDTTCESLMWMFVVSVVWGVMGGRGGRFTVYNYRCGSIIIMNCPLRSWWLPQYKHCLDSSGNYVSKCFRICSRPMN